MTLSSFIILLICSVAFGTTIGAYFTTTDYRIRHNESLFTGPCRCPTCHHALSIIYQVPIISWIFLHGKCHYCQAPIPKRYPLIEGCFLLFYGLTFLLLWKHPFLMLLLWLMFIYIILLFRCYGHFRAMAKGFFIFTGYHIMYGVVLLAIFAAL